MKALAGTWGTTSQSSEAYCYGPVEEAAEAEGYDTETAVEAAEEVADEAEAAADAVETVEIVEAVADAGYGRRDCTPEEEAEQRAEWEERQERRKERDRQQMEQFSKLMGGIDPTDPECAAGTRNSARAPEGLRKGRRQGRWRVRRHLLRISGTLNMTTCSR